MVVRYHENTAIEVKRDPKGNILISYMEDTGHEVNIFPMKHEAALDFAETIKKKALNIEIPGA